jgi:hypothetical protein
VLQSSGRCVRGIRPSTHTIVVGIELTENRLVVDQIRAILTMDYCVYGYRKMTEELHDMEYGINAKKDESYNQGLQWLVLAP